MEASYLQRHQSVRDALNFVAFVALVLIGTLLINTFIFRSFNVVGPSMEPTFYTGDRLIVDRLPVTWAHLQNKPYVPHRGQIIVFKNPRFVEGQEEKFIVKRVIAFPGERVTVKDGVLKVYNKENPNGFEPDALDTNGKPGSPTSGDVDTVVPDGALFVSGDHRVGNYSYDSRSGLGMIPYYDIIGPVSFRIWPLDKISTY
ncbi:MAG TPA: signal peptidase I [Patescibacteria group bacterium]|jgi:signal peptidase I|nr:signal peptidase I [Patescibacteria group bacterium]